jgi:hypothetical protein
MKIGVVAGILAVVIAGCVAIPNSQAAALIWINLFLD